MLLYAAALAASPLELYKLIVGRPVRLPKFFPGRVPQMLRLREMSQMVVPPPQAASRLSTSGPSCPDVCSRDHSSICRIASFGFDTRMEA
jgi:hypothetical protein